MIGSTLRNILEEKKISVSELSRLAGVPAQTLYSIIKRDSMKISFELLLHLCQVLQEPIERFFPHQAANSAAFPSPEEWALLQSYRALDDHGRRMIHLVLQEEVSRLKPSSPPRS